jgi:membrane protein DedA with SNARE-associated domain
MFNSYFLTLSDHPLLLATALFFATFVVEDVATIGAGVLVAQTGADPVAAVSGLIIGTAFGDLALYAFGRWGADTNMGRKLRTRPDVQRAERWIAGQVLALVFAARFLPGSRLPVYTASGLVAAPLAPVAGIIAFTTPLWTGSLFTIARLAGETGAQQFLTTALPCGLLLAACALMFRRMRAPMQLGIN